MGTYYGNYLCVTNTITSKNNNNTYLKIMLYHNIKTFLSRNKYISDNDLTVAIIQQFLLLRFAKHEIVVDGCTAKV